jgi:hypothetical protein
MRRRGRLLTSAIKKCACGLSHRPGEPPGLGRQRDGWCSPMLGLERKKGKQWHLTPRGIADSTNQPRRRHRDRIGDLWQPHLIVDPEFHVFVDDASARA